MMSTWDRSKGSFLAVIAAPALWIVLFFVVPLSVIWAYSFGRTLGLTEVAVTGTLANYARVFDPVYLMIFGKSLVFAGLTTAVCLLVGFPYALAMTFASDRGKILLLLGIMLPFWTNLLVRTYALMAVMRTEGYINDVFGLVGLGPFEMLHTNFAVIVGLVYVHLPFIVLPLYSTLDRMDRSLIEASLDLGAGHITTMLKVVIPIAKPGILSAIMLTFIPALGSYLTPDLLGGPDSQMIASVIERQFKRANDWPFGAALSFMLMYLTLLAMGLRALYERRQSGARTAGEA
ncbi:ABC transporter permease [Novosphingobium pituita]|jgi:spermidine/putrescine transport system permease protein|uniref:ABC transporter permease n=1 Tax=Novosphingobium pituita TaxID=3056842 RepID=A0ABQ6PA78_9SPHN|nr:ABC transporter permease [Novosphingobium sp. IK01]MDK4807235.1 ABC transporter permease [Novosphingobium aromaticivorans]GMM61790.1 ABC transporter permease [Novosphingobium sp. IK01]HIQ17712.1 ABC transporter permease [Novosphingobium capsulatum]